MAGLAVDAASPAAPLRTAGSRRRSAAYTKLSPQRKGLFHASRDFTVPAVASGPPSPLVSTGLDQNGFTITSTTIPIISTVGISLIIRQCRCETVFRSSANRRTAAEK